MTDYTKLIEQLRSGKVSYYEGRSADAIEALQKEVSALDVLLEECKMDWSGDVTQIKAEHKREIEAMQSKLGDAIRSLANWQHQFTEAQAENERLAHANNALKLAVSGMQAKLDAMGKGEPVATLFWHWYDDEKGSFNTDLMLPPFGGMADDQEVQAYAAPKALAPLTDEQIYNVFASTVEDAEPFSELVGDPIWAEVVEITRAIEAAHGIGGAPC